MCLMRWGISKTNHMSKKSKLKYYRIPEMILYIIFYTVCNALLSRSQTPFTIPQSSLNTTCAHSNHHIYLPHQFLQISQHKHTHGLIYDCLCLCCLWQRPVLLYATVTICLCCFFMLQSPVLLLSQIHISPKDLQRWETLIPSSQKVCVVYSLLICSGCCLYSASAITFITRLPIHFHYYESVLCDNY